MAKNTNLHAAKTAKNDEFYTRFDDINFEINLKVPDNWTDFDNERDELQQYIAEKLDNGEKADKIINIIDNNWCFFAEETAVLVEVEGYDCLTIVDEDDNVNETVYPFDENRTYPMQKMEQKLYFKRY